MDTANIPRPVARAGAASGDRLFVAALVALVLAVHAFVFRAAVANGIDVEQMYVGSLCWLRGLSPYNPAILQNLCKWEHVTPALYPYPPLGLPLYGGLALLPWHAVRPVYFFVNEAALLATLGMARTWMRPSLSPRQCSLCLAAGALALPTLACFIDANCPMIVTALLVAALFLVTRRPEWAWTCLGLAMLKPQLALVYAALPARLLPRQKWTVLVPATIVFVLLNVWGCARTEGMPTLGSWLKTVTVLLLPGGMNHPAGPDAQYLIGFYDAGYWLGLPLKAAEGLGALLSLALLAVTVLLCRDVSISGVRLKHLALLGSGSLLFLYHRYYDAGALVFVLAYFLAQSRHPRVRAISLCGLALTLLFMFALPSQLITLLRHGAQTTGRVWLLPLVMPLRTYVLTLIFSCAALVAFRQPGTQEDAAPTMESTRGLVTNP